MGDDGKKSPLWALWEPLLIKCDDGSDYLFRRRVFQTPWFGVFIHDIYEPDPDRDPHDHPYPFLSIVLRGAYMEEVFSTRSGWAEIIRDTRYIRRWLPLSWHKMTKDKAHRIIEAWPGTKTLVLVGPRRGEWYFWTPEGRVLWSDYLKREQVHT